MKLRATHFRLIIGQYLEISTFNDGAVWEVDLTHLTEEKLEKKMPIVVIEAGGKWDGKSSPQEGLTEGSPIGEIEKHDNEVHDQVEGPHLVGQDIFDWNCDQVLKTA